MLKKQKAENRNGCKNRKTGRFEYKNRKIDLKNDQNSKTENPNAPLSDKSRATLKLKVVLRRKFLFFFLTFFLLKFIQ